MPPVSLLHSFSRSELRFCAVVVAALAVNMGSHAAGPTGLLNDTGQILCDNGSHVLTACSSVNAGDTSTMPRQDGRFGRDAVSVSNPAVLRKVGGGDAGFDFTKVCQNGSLNCTGAANTTANPGPDDWACTKDNVTNLIWSLEAMTGTWDTAVVTLPNATNAAGRCGYTSGWRLPTLLELHSIVHYGVPKPNPKVDQNYFPNIVAQSYWTGEPHRAYSNSSWTVEFQGGITRAQTTATYSNNVLLVRNGQ